MTVKEISRDDRSRMRRAVDRLNDENAARKIGREMFVFLGGLFLFLLVVYLMVKLFMAI